MGLDMYLNKAKKVKGVTVKDLCVLENYFDYMTRPNKYYDDTPEEWCGLNMKDVNLDFAKDYITEYTYRYSVYDVEKKYGYGSIFEEIGYWRKANHIHKWFVKNVQNGVDNCEAYEVTKAQFEELLNVCKTVLRSSRLIDGKMFAGRELKNGKLVNVYENGECIEDPSVAKELLPTTDGFFFGGTDYDKYYYTDVEETVRIIEKVLETTDFEKEIVTYRSSW